MLAVAWSRRSPAFTAWHARTQCNRSHPYLSGEGTARWIHGHGRSSTLSVAAEPPVLVTGILGDYAARRRSSRDPHRSHGQSHGSGDRSANNPCDCALRAWKTDSASVNRGRRDRGAGQARHAVPIKDSARVRIAVPALRTPDSAPLAATLFPTLLGERAAHRLTRPARNSPTPWAIGQ